jgi:RNA polymerase sigma-70 factor, ECF subfamily
MYCKSKSHWQKNSCRRNYDYQHSIDLIAPEIPRLRRYARTLARDQDRADDLVHDCLVRAVENIEKWQPGTHMRPWLMVILRNIFYNNYRRSERERHAVAELKLSTETSTAPRQEHYQELEEVRAAFKALSDAHREVISLVIIDGTDYETAAQVLDVELGTVKSRLSRARQELRAKVDTNAATLPRAA